jgi:hypothetical protein
LPEIIAPVIWFVSERASGEPKFNEPCPQRRGRIIRRDGLFLHFCIACGAWGAYGYGVTGDYPGQWYCSKHRPQNEGDDGRL